MLYIKVWLQLVHLVGEVMLGRRLVDILCQESQKNFDLSNIFEDQYWNHQVI